MMVRGITPTFASYLYQGKEKSRAEMVCAFWCKEVTDIFVVPLVPNGPEIVKTSFVAMSQ